MCGARRAGKDSMKPIQHAACLCALSALLALSPAVALCENTPAENRQAEDDRLQTGKQANLRKLPNKKSDKLETLKKGSVLTVTVDEDLAILTGRLSGIRTLKAQGVEKIVFVTKDATSAFRLADLLEKGAAEETYKLTHDGKTAAFTAGGQQTDISDILVKA